MNKKISTGFAFAVIIALVGFFTFVFLRSKSDTVPPVSNSQNVPHQNEMCTKRAYNGKVTIRGWYEKSDDGILIHIVSDDVKKLPAGHEKSLAKLVDGSPEIIKKLKKSSEKNPQEITIQGFFDPCEEPVLVSIASGEEVFKKYLKA